MIEWRLAAALPIAAAATAPDIVSDPERQASTETIPPIGNAAASRHSIMIRLEATVSYG